MWIYLLFGGRLGGYLKKNNNSQCVWRVAMIQTKILKLQQKVICHMTCVMCHMTTTVCSFNCYQSNKRLGDTAAGCLVFDRVNNIYTWHMTHDRYNVTYDMWWHCVNILDP